MKRINIFFFPITVMVGVRSNLLVYTCFGMSCGDRLSVVCLVCCHSMKDKCKGDIYMKDSCYKLSHSTSWKQKRSRLQAGCFVCLRYHLLILVSVQKAYDASRDRPRLSRSRVRTGARNRLLRHLQLRSLCNILYCSNNSSIFRGYRTWQHEPRLWESQS